MMFSPWMWIYSTMMAEPCYISHDILLCRYTKTKKLVASGLLFVNASNTMFVFKAATGLLLF